MKYCIDGKFLTKGHMGGQERYSYEILNELDKIIKHHEVELVVPSNAANIPNYNNIKIVKYGKLKGVMWEQFSFLMYLIKHKRTPIYLCNTFNIFRPDIVTLHDAAVFAIPELALTFYGKLSREYHRFLFRIAARKSKVIFTISQYSKKELYKYLRIKTKNVYVVDCGWQHMNNIIPDEGIFTTYSCINKKEYYLAVSSRVPHKNFKWIEENAKNNPRCVYVIAGKKVGSTVESENEKPKNVLYVGAVTDGELKALMSNCKAIIHPAIYEGFGMTPIEAMSVGATAIISNASCLPEIYGNSVHYIDPYDSKIELDELLKEKIESNDLVLNRYSWKNNATKLLQVIREL